MSDRFDWKVCMENLQRSDQDIAWIEDIIFIVKAKNGFQLGNSTYRVYSGMEIDNIIAALERVKHEIL